MPDEKKPADQKRKSPQQTASDEDAKVDASDVLKVVDKKSGP